ncbi:hypothetical protein BDV93DRAFT_526377 [Ceratobasidium sp. AG-I]|nr:hypothetical protein BDV93DRAFT_526377 [Ceratobasidium sp. AG-I]
MACFVSPSLALISMPSLPVEHDPSSAAPADRHPCFGGRDHGYERGKLNLPRVSAQLSAGSTCVATSDRGVAVPTYVPLRLPRCFPRGIIKC